VQSGCRLYRLPVKNESARQAWDPEGSMRIESHEDLQKQLESILRWLVNDVGALIRESPRGDSPTGDPSPTNGKAADGVRGNGTRHQGDPMHWTAGKLESLVSEFRDAIANFLQGAPGDPLQFHPGSQRPASDSPLEEFRRLQESWSEFLGQVLVPGRLNGLHDVQERFTDVLVLRHLSLRDLLGASRQETTRASPGRVAVLYDPSRGILLRGWLEKEPEGLQAALKTVRRGSLIIGGAGWATARMFAELSQRGLYGVFPLRPERAHTLLGIRQAGRLQRNVLDWPVRLKGREKPLPLRILSRMCGETHDAAVTNVVDRRLLEASTALHLSLRDGTRPWSTSRLLAEVRPWVRLARLSLPELALKQAQNPLPDRVEAHVRTALLMASVFQGVHWWCDGGFRARTEGRRKKPINRAVLRAEPDPGKIFGRLLGLTASLAERMLRTSRAPSGRRPETAPSDGHAQALLRRTSGPARPEELEAIAKSSLEPAFEPFSQRYAGVGHRDAFLWRWVQHGLELTTLPSVDRDLRGRDKTAKLLGVMLDVLLDDVADNFKDGRLLEALLEIPYGLRAARPGGLSPEKVEYYRFAVEVWSAIDGLARSFPRYREFEEILEFDYRQLLNTMRYAYLVNRTPQLLNSTEHDLYQPHNMHMMISGTLDLMCSPGFDVEELSLVRQALWHGQVMGRIGNMVSTWEREIQEGDFTSGVFAATIERGVLAAADLAVMAPTELVSTIESSGVIGDFLGEWARRRDRIYAIAGKVTSVDLSRFAAGLEELLRFHLGSRGLK
jgi:hypothetical protein